jgi:thioredoxin
MPIIEINQNNFCELERHDAEALVEFYAPWCASCRAIAPTLERFSQKHPQLLVCKINTDHSPELSGRYKIMSIPTLIYMKEGRELSRNTGAMGLRGLEQMMEVPRTVK